MTETESETWAPIPGYEGLYEISDQGRVRGLEREVPHEGSGGTQTVEARIISPWIADSGTKMVSLSRSGIEYSVSVPRILLLAHGPKPESPDRVAKKVNSDGDLCLSNLEWRRPITQSKLTEEEAATIYKWAWGTSMTNREVGQHFGVSQQTVSHIKHGRVWSHVTDDINHPDSEDESQPNQYS